MKGLWWSKNLENQSSKADLAMERVDEELASFICAVTLQQSKTHSYLLVSVITDESNIFLVFKEQSSVMEKDKRVEIFYMVEKCLWWKFVEDRDGRWNGHLRKDMLGLIVRNGGSPDQRNTCVESSTGTPYSLISPCRRALLRVLWNWKWVKERWNPWWEKLSSSHSSTPWMPSLWNMFAPH